MPYARTRKTTSPGRLNSPTAANPQLSGRTRRATLPWYALRRVDKAPRNSDLRHESQREPAGQSVVHTQKSATNQKN